MPTTTAYSYKQLERLWISAGGSKATAPTAAAVALAESAGNPLAHNSSGATGLWQILGSDSPGNLYSPRINAKNAVEKWKAAKGFSPWTTYTSGAYLSHMPQGKAQTENASFLQFLPGGQIIEGVQEGFEGKLPNPFSGLEEGAEAVGKVGSSIGSITSFFGDLTHLLFTPEGLLQLAELIGGVVLVVWGLHRIFRATTGVDLVKSGTRAAGKAGEAAMVFA